MRNKDKPWFNDQYRNAFSLKKEAHLLWTRDRSRVNWEEFVCCLVRANEAYSEAKRQFSDRNRDVLMNVQSPHKWWSTLNVRCTVRVRHCLRALVRVAVDWCVSRLVRLICCWTILAASSPGRPLICRSLVIRLLVLPFATMSSVVRRLLLDLDPYGGTDPLGMFPLFLKGTADVTALCLSIVFRRLVRLGCFPACWREANVTLILKGPPSSFVANY